MADRSDDWIGQAARDLAAARVQRDADYPEWACFIAQQASEKALKSVLQKWGAEAWGHACLQLLAAIEERTGLQHELQDDARTVDRYHVPARYPNVYADGKPGDYITKRDADDAIGSAEKIIRFCNGLLA